MLQQYVDVLEIHSSAPALCAMHCKVIHCIAKNGSCPFFDLLRCAALMQYTLTCSIPHINARDHESIKKDLQILEQIKVTTYCFSNRFSK